MFEKLFAWLSTPTQQSELDAFIVSKQPTTPAEVEYWIRYYDEHTAKGWVL